MIKPESKASRAKTANPPSGPTVPQSQSPATVKVAKTSSKQLSPDDVRKIVGDEIQKELAKELTILKDALALGGKIVLASFAVLLAGLTIFGITSWQDVKKQVAEIVTQQTESLIVKNDTDTGVKAKLNDLLNRTVIAYALAGKSRELQDSTGLDVNDWHRLQDWIKREDLALQDFEDALAVLDRQPSERKASDANKLLSQMLNPPADSTYSWMRLQPEKTEAILRSFRQVNLGAGAVEIALSASVPQRLRSISAEYVLRVRYTEGCDRMMQAYAGLAWNQLKISILASCFQLQPANPDVRNALLDILNGKPTSESVRALGRVLAGYPQISEIQLGDQPLNPSKGELDALMNRGLEYVATNSTWFAYQPTTFVPRETGEEVLVRPGFVIWKAISTSGAMGIGTFSVAEFSRFSPYWKALGDAANKNNVALVAQLLPRFEQDGPIETGLDGNILPNPTVLISGNAQAQLGLRQKDANFSKFITGLQDLTLQRRGRPPHAEVVASWREGKVVQSAIVNDFKGFDFKFSLSDNGVE